MKQYFLFDLDGTVADNGEGIFRSAQYALDAFGIHGESQENLRRFVGPPLDQSFMEFYGFSREQALEAVKKYREPGVFGAVVPSGAGVPCHLQASGFCPEDPGDERDPALVFPGGGSGAGRHPHG